MKKVPDDEFFKKLEMGEKVWKSVHLETGFNVSSIAVACARRDRYLQETIKDVNELCEACYRQGFRDGVL